MKFNIEILIKKMLILLFISINIFIFIPQMKRSLGKIDRLDNKILEIDSQIKVINRKIIEYDIKILDSKNSFYREKIGREKLQMVREGEKIYKQTF